METGERDLAAFAETAHELVDVLDEAPDPEGDASSLEVDALRVANKKPVLGSVGLPAFAIGEFMSTVAGGSRKMHERREEEQRAEERKWKEHREERQRKTAMFVTPALPLLAMASSFDSSYWEKELKADLRHDRPFPKYVASRSRMKDLDGEFINLAKYCLWLKFILRGEMEVLERPRIQFYGDLHKEAESDYYEVCKDWDILLSRAT